MGWGGENRRVWVEDGAGRREYTYDAWGRVREQRGCCGSGEGIEVVAVSAEYDPAGRLHKQKELRADGSVIRQIDYDYDELGRFRYATDGQQQVMYRYDRAGRLWQIEHPENELIEYIYYGADTPSQIGFLKRVEHRAPDGTLQNGAEYLYDLLGRVETITELPTGNRVQLDYDGVGRRVREERTGEPYYLIRRVYQQGFLFCMFVCLRTGFAPRSPQNLVGIW